MMPLSVEFHPLFYGDVEHHALYIEGEAGMGLEFLDKVEEAIGIIRANPSAYGILHGTVRHAILGKFKNHIIHYEFSMEENTLRFYALYHAAEDPRKWTERL
jgi:hypothetical protein